MVVRHTLKTLSIILWLGAREVGVRVDNLLLLPIPQIWVLFVQRESESSQ